MIETGDIITRKADRATFRVVGSDDSSGRPVWVLEPVKIFGAPITASADELRTDYTGQRDAQDPQQPDEATGWRTLATRNKAASMAAAVEAGELTAEDPYNATLRADTDPAEALDRHADELPDGPLGDERQAHLRRVTERMRWRRPLTPNEIFDDLQRQREARHDPAAT